MQVATSFPDSTYSSGNLPSVTTLQADISALETAHNETDSKAIREDGTNPFGADQSMGGYKLTNVGTPTAGTDGATLSVVQALYPIGSLYLNASNATNPGTLLGFGTWTAFGAGRTLVGLDSGDTDFDTAGETGGSKTAQITTDHLPTHSHSFSATSGAGGGHGHTITDPTHGHATQNRADRDSNLSVSGGKTSPSDTGQGSLSANGSLLQNSATGISVNAASDHTHSVSGNTGNAGSGNAFSVQNKYITIYMWQRTA
jgi:hypothetical protein